MVQYACIVHIITRYHTVKFAAKLKIFSVQMIIFHLDYLPNSGRKIKQFGGHILGHSLSSDS